MSCCKNCKHWGAEAGEVVGLCLVPVSTNLPTGITLHREMMGPQCGTQCCGFSEKPIQTGEVQ